MIPKPPLPGGWQRYVAQSFAQELDINVIIMSLFVDCNMNTIFFFSKAFTPYHLTFQLFATDF